MLNESTELALRDSKEITVDEFTCVGTITMPNTIR